MDSHLNFATSLVATAPSPATSGTSLIVTAGQGSRFPATPFNAVICPASSDATPANAEVVRVTTVSTDTFTITRATESSSARTVVVGDRIYAGVTAKTLTDIEAADAAAGTASLRTLGSGATQAAAGNHTHTEAQVTGLVNDLALGDGGMVVPTGVTYQNMPRWVSAAAAGALTSGTMKLTAIWLPTGFTVTSISFVSGTTALATAGSPHSWVALYDSALALLRQSTDNVAPSWAASVIRTTNLSSTFQTTYTGLHYLGLMIVSGSVQPTLTTANYGSSVTQLGDMVPVLAGNSTTGLTTTAPNPAAALTSGTGGATSMPYAGVA